MQITLDNITRYCSTPTSLKRLCGVVLLCVATGFMSTTPALAQDQDEEQDNTLDQRFEAEEDEGANTVTIQPPGGKKITYRVKDESTDDRLLFTLIRPDGDEILFSYDEGNSEIAITREDTELQVTIVDAKKIISIDGQGECPREDYSCIVNKVRKGLGQFPAEDLAAVGIVMDDELREVDDGQHIGQVMAMLVKELLGGDL